MKNLTVTTLALALLSSSGCAQQPAQLNCWSEGGIELCFEGDGGGYLNCEQTSETTVTCWSDEMNEETDEGVGVQRSAVMNPPDLYLPPCPDEGCVGGGSGTDCGPSFWNLLDCANCAGACYTAACLSTSCFQCALFLHDVIDGGIECDEEDSPPSETGDASDSTDAATGGECYGFTCVER